MRRLIYIFTLLLLTLQAQGQLHEFNSRLTEASSENRTIVAKFKQTKRVTGIKDLIVSQGDFYYHRDGKMAMVYSEPKGDKVVMSGENFEITTAGKTIKSSASSNPMMAQISYMMQASMSGDVAKLGKGWKVDIKESTNQYTVIITPTDRRIKRYISSMTMTFCSSTMTLDKLLMEETNGGYTSYIFTNKAINQEIDPEKFE